MKHRYIWIPILGIIIGLILIKKQKFNGNFFLSWFVYQLFIFMFSLMTLVQINAGVIKL